MYAFDHRLAFEEVRLERSLEEIAGVDDDARGRDSPRAGRRRSSRGAASPPYAAPFDVMMAVEPAVQVGRADDDDMTGATGCSAAARTAGGRRNERAKQDEEENGTRQACVHGAQALYCVCDALPRPRPTAVAILHFAFILFVIAGGLLVLRWPALTWIHLPAAIWGALIEIRRLVLSADRHSRTALLRRAGARRLRRAASSRITSSRVIYPAGLTRGMEFAIGVVRPRRQRRGL